MLLKLTSVLFLSGLSLLAQFNPRPREPFPSPYPPYGPIELCTPVAWDQYGNVTVCKEHLPPERNRIEQGQSTYIPMESLPYLPMEGWYLLFPPVPCDPNIVVGQQGDGCGFQPRLPGQPIVPDDPYRPKQPIGSRIIAVVIMHRAHSIAFFEPPPMPFPFPTNDGGDDSFRPGTCCRPEPPKVPHG